MNKKYLILSLLLVFFISAGHSLGENANNSSITAVADLKYIWSVTGIESEKITMVLNQDGKDLFGQAKYEPDNGKKWNAEVVGSIEGNNVGLTLSAQKDKETVTTKMTGIFDNTNQTISGSFSQVSSGKIVNKGNFSAMSISPDTSSYAPATTEEPKAETLAPAVVNTTAAVETTTAATENSLPTSSSKSYFHDVRQDADKILTGVGDISQIPIGMGGSGLS
jgi:hypothetical protein